MSIDYPIRKESEQWLLSRLPGDANHPDLSLLFRLVSDLKIDGSEIDAMRASRLFELKEPLARDWGDGNRLTWSQIIHILAFGGEIVPRAAGLYTRVLGLTFVLSDPHPPSDNIEQFKTLMCAIVMSERLNAPIGIEY